MCVRVCRCVCPQGCLARPGQPTYLTVRWPRKQDPDYSLGPTLHPLEQGDQKKCVCVCVCTTLCGSGVHVMEVRTVCKCHGI